MSTRILLTVMVAISVICSASSAAENVVHLRVMLNGRRITNPREVLVSGEGISTKVPLRNDEFQLPAKLTESDAVDVEFRTDGGRVKLRKLSPSRFSGWWNVILDDQSFGEKYAVPSNAPAKTFCVVEFDTGGDGVYMVEPGCRVNEK